ncbi:MAG: diaminopimelate epimerase [Halodesulfurarchaeum sp.]
MRVAYRQYHGTGNTFAVVEAKDLQTGRSAFAMKACDRLGIDGVLVLDIEESIDPIGVDFKLFQPDGGTAEMCGNGARVAALWAQERTEATEFTLDTPAGPRRTTLKDDGNVTVEMGEPTFEPASVPLVGEEPMIEEPFEGLTITAVNTGVPHAVAFLHDVEELALEAAAQPIRYADRFPAGTNVTVAEYIEEGQFRQRTYERGVEGETQSCGTGAVAIVATAVELGLAEAGETVQVDPPGGTLRVTLPENGPATLAGPAVFEEEGELDVDGGDTE